MKKFLIFTGFLTMLIASEYFLINEFFFDRRAYVLLLSLLATLFFAYLAIRFFKKFMLPGKHPKAHN